MNEQEFLKRAIDHCFEYFDKSSGQSYSIDDFHTFLTIKIYPEASEEDRKVNLENKKFTSEADELGIYLVLLNRYAKAYVKNALEGSNLKTADEFSFLITLFTGNSHTKAELIDKMVLNRTSGIEVIKRLLKKDLIEEFDDPDDKRSKRVVITESGKGVVLQLLPKISKSSQQIAGNLNNHELKVVNKILSKLEYYHRQTEI